MWALLACCLPLPTPAPPPPVEAEAETPPASPAPAGGEPPAIVGPGPAGPLPSPSCPAMDEALCTAVTQTGDLGVIEARLAAGTPADCPCTYQWQARRLASYVPIVKDFLSTQYRTYTEVQTPLFIAVLREQRPMAELLLRRGAHPDFPGPHGEIPLDAALAGTDRPAMLDLLLAAGADARRLDLGEVDGVSTARRLVAAGADRRSLDLPCLGGDARELDWFLAQKPDLRDEDAAEVLRLPPEAVGRLLDAGLPPDTRSQPWGRPLLHEAVQAAPALVPTLLAHGADPEGTADSSADSALCVAAAAGADEAVVALLAAGARLERACDAGETPLAKAAVAGRPATVRLLLDRGALPNPRDEHGQELVVRLVDEVCFWTDPF